MIWYALLGWARAPDASPTLTGAVLLGAIIANASLAWTSLWPNGDNSNDAGHIATRFGQMLAPSAYDQLAVRHYTLFEMKRFPEVLEVAEAMMEGRTNSPEDLARLVDSCNRVHGPAAALARYRAVVTAGPPTPNGVALDMREAWLAANLAIIGAMTDDPAELPMAAVFADRLEAMYDPAVAEGTVGAVRLLQGEVETGEALLARALRQASSALDRADFCRLLARAALQRGDAVVAEDYERLGRHLAALPA